MIHELSGIILNVQYVFLFCCSFQQKKGGQTFDNCSLLYLATQSDYCLSGTWQIIHMLKENYSSSLQRDWCSEEEQSLATFARQRKSWRENPMFIFPLPCHLRGSVEASRLYSALYKYRKWTKIYVALYYLERVCIVFKDESGMKERNIQSHFALHLLVWKFHSAAQKDDETPLPSCPYLEVWRHNSPPGSKQEDFPHWFWRKVDRT